MCRILAAQQAPVAHHTAQADSRDAVGWLEGQGIDLSGLVQLGGHSKKRTHTSSRGPVGFSIMKALLDRQMASERIEVIASANVRGQEGEGRGGWGCAPAAACFGARQTPQQTNPQRAPPSSLPLPNIPQVTSLLHAGSRVEGIEYTDQHGERQRLEASAVILATGGFGASASLLRQYAPQVGGAAVWECREVMRGRRGRGEQPLRAGSVAASDHCRVMTALLYDARSQFVVPSSRPHPTPPLPPSDRGAAHHQRAVGTGRGAGPGPLRRRLAAAPGPSAGAHTLMLRVHEC